MTLVELQEKQSWPLEQKVAHSLNVISSFVHHRGGADRVYVSVSGGKDSDVLLHLCRMLYPDIMAVFINTGNEFPEIIQHIAELEKAGVNLVRLRPSMTPREVYRTIGFPLVSKDAAQKIEQIRRNPNCATSQKWMSPDNPFCLGKRWRYLLDEPYNTSNHCCKILKKQPAQKFEKETRRSPIVGIMASESKLRETSYITRGGCNSFSSGRSVSWPLAIWTDDDIWEFIEHASIHVAEIYKKGASRTGCVCCGFGAYKSDAENPGLSLLYRLYPKYYEMVMNYTNNGVTYREALRKLKAVTNQKLPEDYDKKPKRN